MFDFTRINFKQHSRISNSVWRTHKWVVGSLLIDATEGDQLFIYTARDRSKSVSMYMKTGKSQSEPKSTCKQESHSLITKYVQTRKSQSDHKVRVNKKVTI